MKTKTIYKSIFAEEMVHFVKLRQAQGFKDKNIHILSKFDEYLASKELIEKRIEPNIVESWLSSHKERLHSRTISQYTSYYTQFAKYLNTLGFAAFIPEYHPPSQDYRPYVFSEQEIAAILAAADNLGMYSSNTSGVQIPMLIRILYGCGIRLGEALALKKSDIDTDNGVIFLQNAKNNKDRIVPVDNALTDILKDYCDIFLCGKSQETYLFESDRKDSRYDCTGQPRYPTWARKHFAKILKEAGIMRYILPPRRRNICPHCLRHTFAVHSFRKQEKAGIDNYDISPGLSIYLGHDGLDETEEYLHMTAEVSEDIIQTTQEYSRGMFPEVPK